MLKIFPRNFRTWGILYFLLDREQLMLPSFKIKDTAADFVFNKEKENMHFKI